MYIHFFLTGTELVGALAEIYTMRCFAPFLENSISVQKSLNLTLTEHVIAEHLIAEHLIAEHLITEHLIAEHLIAEHR